ncbi:MAG: GNAT family N-acetyltransferase [archaeon]|nr:GNAT family N-acetyltransferase [archaeon]
MMQVEYYSKKTESLTEEEFQECSVLYSENYGEYSKDEPTGKAGRNVKMSANFYRKNFVHPGYHVALAKYGGKLVGQAFYIREIMDEDVYTWVLQLVVHKDYREKGIGSKLLHSIWGFSNDVAWGLATSNPFTIKTLERTTLRHVSPVEIQKHEEFVRKVCSSISYISDLQISPSESIANTKFFVDGEGMHADKMSKFGPNWLLGTLPSGHEWVAFTFRDQEFDKDFQKELLQLISFSEECLKEAYGRMKMDVQPWAKHSSKELRVLENLCGGFDDKTILDAGCGQGRHSLALIEMANPKSLTSIDMSSDNIAIAKSKPVSGKVIDFRTGDLRRLGERNKYDLVICLYDVVGSFPDDDNNRQILTNLYDALVEGGKMAISVMNFELTLANVHPEYYGNIQDDPQILFNLPPSDTMQSSGNVFDPDYYAIDSTTKLVYRKEQFHSDESLPAEYVIRDKRYSLEEITSLVTECGFEVINSRYVQAGHWDVPLGAVDPKAKEILLILQK